LAEEAALLDRVMAWQQEKCDAGFGALTWPVEFGGQDLPPEYDDAFGAEEEQFVTPESHEAFSITLNLIAPTIRLLGTKSQRDRFVKMFVRTDELCAQLFSEPSAGSDLASVGMQAVRRGDEWVLNGQKVWSSGAQFATWGELIARTDTDVVKHAGMTAFLIPLDGRGVDVRPIRQMSGGASFNEVFLTDVTVPDELRLGEVGDGWRTALTTLGFERGNAKRQRQIGGSWRSLRQLAEHLGRTSDPLVRQKLVDVYIHDRISQIANLRAGERRRSGQPPGPEGSLNKLAWVGQLDRIADTVASVLGPRLAADTGEWGTYAWSAHVLGARGYHIAGGSDEIQKNIVGERVLGLPAEPRLDRVPWRELVR
jgi:alkylation response protein AidB-like acyl-CoA dehydrogenase